MKKLNESSLGIDISKHFLDIYHLPNNISKKYENTPQGVKSLLKWMAKKHIESVVFEPTGGYEKLLRITLTKANIPFSMVNAKRIRDYAKAKGLLSKTDKIDANLLAEYAIKIQPKITNIASSKIELLKEWLKCRTQIIDNIKNENQHLEHASCQEIIEMIHDTINHLKQQLGIAEAKIKDIIAEDNTLTIQQELLMQEKGIGFTTSATLLAELPELGLITHQQIAAIVGVAPHCQDSGSFKGRRRVQGGRKKVRNALYMAVISAIKSNSKIKTFYTRLRNNGKPAKVAITACIRKFVIMLNAILRNHYQITGNS